MKWKIIGERKNNLYGVIKIIKGTAKGKALKAVGTNPKAGEKDYPGRPGWVTRTKKQSQKRKVVRCKTCSYSG